MGNLAFEDSQGGLDQHTDQHQIGQMLLGEMHRAVPASPRGRGAAESFRRVFLKSASTLNRKQRKDGSSRISIGDGSGRMSFGRIAQAVMQRSVGEGKHTVVGDCPTPAHRGKSWPSVTDQDSELAKIASEDDAGSCKYQATLAEGAKAVASTEVANEAPSTVAREQVAALDGKRETITKLASREEAVQYLRRLSRAEQPTSGSLVAADDECVVRSDGDSQRSMQRLVVKASMASSALAKRALTHVRSDCFPLRVTSDGSEATVQSDPPPEVPGTTLRTGGAPASRLHGILRLECIVLNGCKTSEIGRHLLTVVENVVVVCWSTLAEDNAARSFSAGFYESGELRSLLWKELALRMGRLARGHRSV